MKSPTLGMTIIGWPEEFEHRKIRPGTGLTVSSTGSFRDPFQTSSQPVGSATLDVALDVLE
jgi:hypothetical protein